MSLSYPMTSTFLHNSQHYQPYKPQDMNRGKTSSYRVNDNQRKRGHDSIEERYCDEYSMRVQQESSKKLKSRRVSLEDSQFQFHHLYSFYSNCLPALDLIPHPQLYFPTPLPYSYNPRLISPPLIHVSSQSTAPPSLTDDFDLFDYVNLDPESEEVDSYEGSDLTSISSPPSSCTATSPSLSNNDSVYWQETRESAEQGYAGESGLIGERKLNKASNGILSPIPTYPTPTLENVLSWQEDVKDA